LNERKRSHDPPEKGGVNRPILLTRKEEGSSKIIRVSLALGGNSRGEEGGGKREEGSYAAAGKE